MGGEKERLGTSLVYSMYSRALYTYQVCVHSTLYEGMFTEPFIYCTVDQHMHSVHIGKSS